MITIVLFDDHQLVREGTKVLLESENDMEVVGATGGQQELMTMLSDLQPRVVIVDLLIDDNLIGFELIKKIHTVYPAVKILVVSMLANKEYTQLAFQAGALGYVPKIEASNSLIEGVRAIIAGNYYISPVLIKSYVLQTGGQEETSEQALEKLLTKREYEIFSLLGEGKSRQEISEILSINQSTVGSHFENIKMKLQIEKLPELVHKAISLHTKNHSNTF